MMRNVPTSVQEPANGYEFIGAESFISEIGHQGGESKLPDAETSVEIGRTGSGNHDGIEVSSIRFLEKRACADV